MITHTLEKERCCPYQTALSRIIKSESYNCRKKSSSVIHIDYKALKSVGHDYSRQSGTFVLGCNNIWKV
jgi:hypothetical protein